MMVGNMKMMLVVVARGERVRMGKAGITDPGYNKNGSAVPGMRSC